ncbi:MAG: MBL fold metallo-hydrolase [Acidimicrobiales bacterium]
MFYGVRGSTPCSCPNTRDVGGNTSCVLVETGGDPIILDLGTGLRYLGRDLLAGRVGASGPRAGGADGGRAAQPLRATALVSHLHWDHIQGIPFFAPMLRPDTDLTIIGPPQDGTTLGAEFRRFVRPPVFPIELESFPGVVTFQDSRDEVLAVGEAKITTFPVPHVGPTNGYRIDVGGGSVAYISDHQQPDAAGTEVSPAIVAACSGVDLLIHDAQFDQAEFEARSDWGHCSTEYAAEVARRCGARRLALYHHDPAHDDAWIAAAVERTARVAGPDIEVLAATEGLRLTSGG